MYSVLLKVYNDYNVVVLGDWKSIQVDDTALQVVHNCLAALQSLVESLLQGHVPLGHLQTCMKYKEQFKRLYQQCMDLNMINILP